MGREMTVPNWDPEYTRLPILLRSFGGDHLAVRGEGLSILQMDAVLIFSIPDPGKEK
jgi:hypothetical protein